jgi:predicted ABC-type ATPase
MIAGPNGSGKTTLTDYLRSSGVDFGNYINADEIARTLAGGYDRRVRRAQSIADEERGYCVSNRLSFSFETVMSHPSKIEVLQNAKAKGFEVSLYFVCTESVDLNVARVAQRVELGGHAVPEEKIRERYERALALLPAAAEVANHVVLFDNSFGRAPGQPAVLRPFCQQANGKLTLQPPIPRWAQSALRHWLPPLQPASSD